MASQKLPAVSTQEAIPAQGLPQAVAKKHKRICRQLLLKEPDDAKTNEK